MQITRTQLQNFRPKQEGLSHSASGQQLETSPKTGDSFSFSSGDSSATDLMVAAAVIGTGGGAALLGGMAIAQYFPSGMSGLSGAVTGLVMGGLSGGASGFGMAKAGNAIDSGGPTSDSITEALGTMGGAAIGALSGAVAGFAGAQPLVVAPTATVAGLTGLLGAGFVAEKLLNDG